MTWLVASNSLSVREAESYAKDMIKSMGLDENKYVLQACHSLQRALCYE